MKLFKSDLYRSLAIGFLIGTAIVGVQAAPEALAVMAPAANIPVTSLIGR